MLEIGSYEGRSAVWFLENILTHPTARIVCVDLFTRLPFELRFDHNIRISGAGDKVTKMKGRSETVLSCFSTISTSSTSTVRIGPPAC